MRLKIIVISFLIPLLLAGEEVKENLTVELTINDAVELGLKNNLNLKNSKIDLNADLLMLATSWNEFIPDTNAGFSYKKNIYDQNNIQSGSSNTAPYGLSLDSSLSINAKSVFNIVQTVNDYNKGLITYNQTKLALIIEIKKSYYNLTLLKQQIELKEFEINNAKILYDTALIKFKDNIISEVDKLKSEYTYKSLVPELNKLKNNLCNSIQNFKLILGADLNKNMILTSDYPEIKIDYEEKINSYNPDKDPDVKILTEELKSKINTRNINIASLTPSFGVGYSLSASNNNSGINQWDIAQGIHLSLSLPLDAFFPFSSVQTEIVKSQSDIKKLSNNVAYEKKKKLIELEKIISNLKDNENSINAYRINAEIAEKTYSMVEKLYQKGSSNYLELQEAEENRFDAKYKLLSSQYDYLSSLFDLEYMLNKEIVR